MPDCPACKQPMYVGLGIEPPKCNNKQCCKYAPTAAERAAKDKGRLRVKLGDREYESKGSAELELEGPGFVPLKFGTSVHQELFDHFNGMLTKAVIGVERELDAAYGYFSLEPVVGVERELDAAYGCYFSSEPFEPGDVVCVGEDGRLRKATLAELGRAASGLKCLCCDGHGSFVDLCAKGRPLKTCPDCGGKGHL